MGTRLTRTVVAVEDLLGVRKATAMLARMREADFGPSPIGSEGIVERVAAAMSRVNPLELSHAVTGVGAVGAATAMAVAGLAAAVRLDPALISDALAVATAGSLTAGVGFVGLAASGAADEQVRLLAVRDTVRSRVETKATLRDELIAGNARLRDLDSSATLEAQSDSNDDAHTPGGP